MIIRTHHVAGKLILIDNNRYRLQRCSVCGELLHFSPTTQSDCSFPEGAGVISANIAPFTAWREPEDFMTRDRDVHCYETFIRPVKDRDFLK